MNHRHLTRSEYWAEVYLASADPLGVLACWIGLALHLEQLIYLGAALMLGRIVAVDFHANDEGLDADAGMRSRVFGLVVSFCVGILVFCAFHSEHLLETYRALSALPSEQWGKALEVLVPPVVRYGLFGVLWIKTAFSVVVIVGATTQVLDYETGRQMLPGGASDTPQ